MSWLTPPLVFTLAAVFLVLARRVSVPVALTLLLAGMLLAGTWAANLIAYPLAVLWSHLHL